MSGVVFINGEYVAAEDARLPMFDMGFLHSDAVMDVTSAWRGYIFKLDAHLARFARSCAGFRLKNPYTDEETAHILAECVRRAGLSDAYVHMHVTRGEYPAGSRDPRLCANRFGAYAVPYIWLWGEQKCRNGASLFISDIERISSKAVNQRFKNFHWADLIQSQFDAFDRGYDDSVLCGPDGNLAEGPGFNIFVVKDGVVSSPATNCLEGISRETAIELCEEEGIRCEVRAVHPDELREADEAFATSTAGGIMPVTSIDGRALRLGAASPISSRLRDLYWRRREAGWHGRRVEDFLEV